MSARDTIKALTETPGLKPLERGDSGDKVRALQTLLYDLGFGHLERREFVDGDYGPTTQAAVALFARGKGAGKRVTKKMARDLVAAADKKAAADEKAAAAKAAAATRNSKKKVTTAARPAVPPESRDLYIGSGGVTARLLSVEPVGQQLENWCWAASTQMMIGYLRSLGETECPTCGRSGHRDEDITQGRQMNRRLGDSEVDCSAERTADFDYKTCDRGGWPYFFEFQDRVQSTKWASRRHVLEEHGLVLLDGGPRLRVRHPLNDWQLRSLTYRSGPEFKKRLDDAEGAALSWETLTGLLDDQRPVAFSFRYPEPGAGHMRLAFGYAVTPGDKRWVAVADPLPPGTGEVCLIPYEYYRDGPFDGHWRDYWVPRARERKTAPRRLVSDQPRVGRELVASYITYPEDPRPKKPPTGGRRLSREDRAAAFLEARAGLVAVEAIASAAEELAVGLGMGGAFTEAFLRHMAGKDPSEYGFRDVSAGDLELHEEDLIPVYELTVKELRKWSPGSEQIAPLLARPREIIYRITRPEQQPFPFFAAVTVRRKGDGWKLASLGRARLMALLEGKGLADSFFGMFSKAPSLERFARFLLFMGDLDAKDVDQLMKSAREADEDARDKRRNERTKEIDELERKLKKELETDSQDAELDGRIRNPEPKYLVNVPEIYQLLVAYSDVAGALDPDPEHPVEPVYPESFHRPERHISSGSLLEVLADLKDVANDREVRRRGEELAE